MKKIILFMACIAMGTTVISCSDDDNNTPSGTGNLIVEFDNVFGANDLILNTASYSTSQNENLKISQVKYIVSNIKLTRKDGTIFTYPKAESYFIVDETDETTHELELSGIPAGDYESISFGIGVDEAQFNLGADGQGNFLAWADSEDMMWSWSAGYKFVMFEGMFTSPTVSSDTMFMVHTGKTGASYNYAEITLPMTNDALVRTNITPQVHIFADVAKIIDGTNKISLTANNMGGMGAMIMGGEALPQITANLQGMFTVNHVHND